MLKHDEVDELLPELEPVITGMGISIVELKSRRVKSRLQVHLIIYKPDGISVEDCSKVYKTIFPRIELITENRNINLEVSSPGITRNFKHVREFTVFRGKEVKIMVKDKNDWERGVIVDSSEEWVRIRRKNEEKQIAFDDIRKAKLGQDEEVR